jgi:putative phage-type endonuclease
VSQANVGELDRQKYLGGSDAAAILGISPWRTQMDVYLDKIQPRKEVDPAKQKIFARGQRLEPYVIDMMIEETGIEVVSRGNRYKDPEHAFMAAEIDAEAATGENIEIKTVSPFKAKEWGEEHTDAVPVHYTAQVMHGLMVTGKDTCLFGVLIGADDFRVYRVERDVEVINMMREKEIAFWNQVVNRQPPEPTTLEDLGRFYSQDDGGAVQADGHILSTFQKLKMLRQQAKLLEDDIVEHEFAIKRYMGDAYVLYSGSTQLCSWKTQQTDRVSVPALREAHPDIARAFTKTTSSRVFRIR